MAIRKKSNVKKSEVDSIKKTVEAIFMRERRLTVSVGISSDYAKEKVGLSLSENVREGADPMELADELYGLLEVKLDELFSQLQGEDEEDENSAPDEDGDEDEEVPEESEEEEEPEEEEEELSEEEILKMKRGELIELIEDEDLKVQPKKYKKIADLRTAVIDELFEEEDGEEEGGDVEEDGDDEWEDDEWED